MEVLQKKPSTFYVVYPSNNKLRELLNALKVLADENQRTEAHITIRGPYSKRLPNTKLIHYSEFIHDQKVKITKVDRFFSDSQNTIYLSCEDTNHALKSIWKKFTYNEFKPHITLYDGMDRDFALKLFNILNSKFTPFDCKLSNLETLQPKNQDSIGLFKLNNKINNNYILKSVFKEVINKDFLLTITKNDRLDKIIQILEILKSNKDNWD